MDRNPPPLSPLSPLSPLPFQDDTSFPQQIHTDYSLRSLRWLNTLAINLTTATWTNWYVTNRDIHEQKASTRPICDQVQHGFPTNTPFPAAKTPYKPNNKSYETFIAPEGRFLPSGCTAGTDTSTPRSSTWWPPLTDRPTDRPTDLLTIAHPRSRVSVYPNTTEGV